MSDRGHYFKQVFLLSICFYPNLKVYQPSQKKELTVYGYCRKFERIRKDIHIIDNIRDIIIEYYTIKQYWNKDMIHNSNMLQLNEDNHCIKHIFKQSWVTAFGEIKTNSGIFQWQIRLKITSKSGHSHSIGIVQADKIHDLSNTFIGSTNTSYGYYSYNGLKHNGTNTREKYGDRWKSGDIITVILDMDNCTLSYKVNDKSQGIAFENITKTEYILGVSTYNIDDEFEWISPLQ